METTIEKPVVATAAKPVKKMVFYRISRLCEEDECRYEEKLVRYALSAWFMNVDRAMKRLENGEKVFTPYAYYVARAI